MVEQEKQEQEQAQTTFKGDARETQLELTGQKKGSMELYTMEELEFLKQQQQQPQREDAQEEVKHFDTEKEANNTSDTTFEGDFRDPRERKLTEYLQYDPSPS